MGPRNPGCIFCIFSILVIQVQLTMASNDTSDDAAIVSGEGDGPSESRQQPQPYRFKLRGQACNFTDAFARLTMEEIIANSQDHCDPRQLLVCTLNVNKQKLCECGLVHAKVDSAGTHCIALTGAPCDNVFGHTALRVVPQCDVQTMVCAKLGLGSVNGADRFTYSSCKCKGSNIPDADGGCNGWKEAAFSIKASLFSVISTSILSISILYYSTHAN